MAVTHVQLPHPLVIASKSTMPKKPKRKLPHTPKRLEKGMTVASIGSKFGGRKGMSRKRKTAVQPMRYFKPVLIRKESIPRRRRALNKKLGKRHGTAPRGPAAAYRPTAYR